MVYTMEDFKRDYIKEHFAKLTPQEQREALERLTPDHRREVVETLLADLSTEQIQQYLARRAAGRSSGPRKPRRKK